MRVLVDTSVWSLALRRGNYNPESPAVKMLTQLIQEFRAVMTGAVRQELLSGIQNRDQFDRLRDKLRAFPDLPPEVEDFELAAELYNVCRANGVQGSNTDFLLCAIAQRHNIALLSTDKDFDHIHKHVRFKLHLLP